MRDLSIEDAVRHLSGHLRRRGLLLDAAEGEDQANPGAQSFEQDRTSGHSTVKFCWEHELDPSECHRRDRFIGDTTMTAEERAALPPAKRTPCVGDPIPMATDTVGELVVAYGARRARQMVDVVFSIEAQVISATLQLDRIYDRLLPVAHVELSLPKATAADGDPGCESCARLNLGTDSRPRGWWNEANYNRGNPTNFGGALPDRMRLCRACAEWALDHDHEHQCVDEDDRPLKGVARYPAAIHLPPVDREGGECLRKKQATGYWTGK